MAKVKQREKRQLRFINKSIIQLPQRQRLLLFSLFLRGIFASSPTSCISSSFFFLTPSSSGMKREKVFRPLLFLMFPSEVCFILVYGWIIYRMTHAPTASSVDIIINCLKCAHTVFSALGVCVLWVRCSFCREETAAYCETGKLYGKNTARACHKEKGKSLKVRFSHSARTNRRNGCSSRKFFLPNETFCGMRVNHLRVFLCGPSSCGREIKLPFITQNARWKIGSVCKYKITLLGLAF